MIRKKGSYTAAFIRDASHIHHQVGTQKVQAIVEYILLGPKHLLRTYYNGTWTLWGNCFTREIFWKTQKSEARLIGGVEEQRPRLRPPGSEPLAFLYVRCWGLLCGVSSLSVCVCVLVSLNPKP